MLKFLENVQLADKTTYRIGGPAKHYVEPHNEDDIIHAYSFAQERGLPVFILGNGSNLLISDSGIDGLVINLSAHFSSMKWDGTMAAVSGGFPLDALAEAAAERGCTGIEGLSGIPGTVGGAVVMNAGAFDTEIADTLDSVLILRVPEMTEDTLLADDLKFGYRTSALKDCGHVVLCAVFNFKAGGDAVKVMLSRQDILKKRREKQPLDYPSCGSVFKRPPGNYAGTLIQSAGLKGFRMGGAMVSEKHANFIINTGNAKAEDVRWVMRHVQKTVFEKSEIHLEPEVIFAGEFNEPLFA
ncbi:MAG: UDP-N-acetylmuramate dehydrogenase [Chitinispirillia bacterium]|nr:UDP-N-acetylmuramate dehydrogenase [Chitinispirillia bacterium]MCL2268191.1 UDP-N-acetylmuramate dehydrogenase [Chitinispirillia bacterium]